MKVAIAVAEPCNSCIPSLKSWLFHCIIGGYMIFVNFIITWVLDASLALSLPKEAKKDATVKHALEVLSAVFSGNYILFFKLYKVAPNLNSCLMGKDDLSQAHTYISVVFFRLQLSLSFNHTYINMYSVVLLDYRPLCGTNALWGYKMHVKIISPNCTNQIRCTDFGICGNRWSLWD